MKQPQDEFCDALERGVSAACGKLYPVVRCLSAMTVVLLLSRFAFPDRITWPLVFAPATVLGMFFVLVDVTFGFVGTLLILLAKLARK